MVPQYRVMELASLKPSMLEAHRHQNVLRINDQLTPLQSSTLQVPTHNNYMSTICNVRRPETHMLLPPRSFHIPVYNIDKSGETGDEVYIMATLYSKTFILRTSKIRTLQYTAWYLNCTEKFTARVWVWDTRLIRHSMSQTCP
jgi:hypothetical protein